MQYTGLMNTKFRPLVFIVDDDPEIRTLFQKLFNYDDYETEVFGDALSALAALRKLETDGERHCNLVISDLKLPDLDGIGLIGKITEAKWAIPTILITAHASVETALEALKKGAFDYVVKPVHLTELSIVANRAIEHYRLQQEHRILKQKLDDHINRSSSLGPIIGRSQKLQQIFDLVDRVARSISNVLITGESGTGKELIARAIHQQSNRRDHPFIAINCSAIPDQLLESELFGHKKGSFTGANENRRGLFEEGQGGTVFLDEIGDMPVELQAKLLRVLQERKVKAVGENQLREIDVRIISATHKNIRALTQEGLFREDLYYRLCVIPIQLPPLRERKEDIPLLAEFFLEKYCKINQVTSRKFTKTALAKLIRLSWPGNIRELENTIERAVVLSDGESVDEQDIQIEPPASQNGNQAEDYFAQLLTLDQLERNYIQYVLQKTGNIKEKAAEILGINRKTLYRKEMEYEASKKEQ